MFRKRKGGAYVSTTTKKFCEECHVIFYNRTLCSLSDCEWDKLPTNNRTSRSCGNDVS